MCMVEYIFGYLCLLNNASIDGACATRSGSDLIMFLYVDVMNARVIILRWSKEFAQVSHCGY